MFTTESEGSDNANNNGYFSSAKPEKLLATYIMKVEGLGVGGGGGQYTEVVQCLSTQICEAVYIGGTKPSISGFNKCIK